jgi:hypothetical protein
VHRRRTIILIAANVGELKFTLTVSDKF